MAKELKKQKNVKGEEFTNPTSHTNLLIEIRNFLEIIANQK